MSSMVIDWCMFGLGVLGVLGVVWLRRTRSSAQRSGRGLGARALGRFTVLVGGVMGLGGLLQFSGVIEWEALAVGFILGGACGAMVGRRWISSHPDRETFAQPRGLSRWLVSWRFQAVLFGTLLFISMVAPFAGFSTLVSSRVNLQAGLQGWLAGLFSVFGLVLTFAIR